MESHDIRIKRIKYLKEIPKLRSQGWNVVYTDETYIHSSHTQDKGWFDDSSKGIRKPISKGQRLIIVHAGGENGFIPDRLLIFRSGKKNIYVKIFNKEVTFLPGGGGQVVYNNYY